MSKYEFAPELKGRDHWICWRFEGHDSEQADSPIAPFDGTTYASISVPETWRSYETAVEYHKRDDTRTDGIAYVLTSDDPIAVAELQGGHHPESSLTEDWMLDIARHLRSYTEKSPQSTDLRVVALASIPDGRSRCRQERTLEALEDCPRPAAVELYDEGQYFRFTGNHIGFGSKAVESRDEAFHQVHAEYVANGDDENEETSSSTQGGASSVSSLTPRNVLATAGCNPNEDNLSDLSDREKAAAVSELIGESDDVHVQVRRESGSFWAYDSGVWENEGERTLRHSTRQALGPMQYGQNVLRETKAQVKGDPHFEVEASELGVPTRTVPVENGLVDLEKAADALQRGNDDLGKDAIRELQPDDYALTQLPVEYDPSAEYGEWASLVEEWVEDDKADALQEYVGYCLHIGDMPIHRAALLVGSGANGKGTFLAVVRALLGSENTSSTELQTLANKEDAVADFHGSLANIDDDLSTRKLGAGIGMFKKLVAGDYVRARPLYKSGFEFRATGKHLYAANEVPQVEVPADDDAFWRRWLIITFPNYYPSGERDTELRDQLTKSNALSGVLNWAIEGWHRLLDQEHFTNEERSAYDKRKRWQARGDSVDMFVSEHVKRDEDAPRMSTGEVYRIYKTWCRENDEEPVRQQQFTNTLKEENVGYKKHRIDGTSTLGYRSLGLSDEVLALDDDSYDSMQGMSF